MTTTMSTNNEDLADLIRENDELFREQFNPESETFHGGSTEEVPVGGQRVPETMDGQEVVEEEGPVYVAWGAEWQALMDLRTLMGDLKKAMNDLVLKVDSTNKMMATLEKGVAEEKLEKAQKVLKARQAKQAAAVEACNELVNSIPSDSKYAEEYATMLAEVVDEAEALPMSQEAFFNFSKVVKSHTTKIVRDQKDLLADIKAVKKDVEERIAAGEEIEGVETM